jgi:enoyl-CoA hydratase/carnithine racemase
VVVAEAFARAWASEDLVEGMAARAAKRPADFRGR